MQAMRTYLALATSLHVIMLLLTLYLVEQYASLITFLCTFSPAGLCLLSGLFNNMLLVFRHAHWHTPKVS